MEIEKILEETVFVSPDMTVSKLVSMMLSENRHEVLVGDADEVKGIITASDIVKKSIPNPEKTGISSFMNHIRPVPYDTEPKDILNSILINDYKTLPVMKDGKVYVIHKLGLLKFFKNQMNFKDMSVNDVMHFPFFVGPDDSIAAARTVIKDMHVSRVVIADSEGRINGIVSTLDLLKTVLTKEKQDIGGGSGEKVGEEVPVKSIASNDFFVVTPKSSLREVVEKMTRENTDSVLVEREGKLAGMITPKDVLKLIEKVAEGPYVRISGVQEEDEFIKQMVYSEIRRVLSKVDKKAHIKYLVMNIDRHHDDFESGKRVKYSAKVRLITAAGDFYAKDHAWDLPAAAKGALKRLEKELMKKEGRMEDMTRDMRI